MEPRKLRYLGIILLVVPMMVILACGVTNAVVPRGIVDEEDEYSISLTQTQKAKDQQAKNKAPVAPPVKASQIPAVKKTVPSPTTDEDDVDSHNLPPLEGTPITPVTFQVGDCTCGNFKVAQSYNEAGYLLCDYGWIGPTTVLNRFTFSIQQQSTVELTRQDAMEAIQRAHSRAEANKADKNMSVIRSDASGFTYALTSQINSNTLTCGEGSGGFLVKDAFRVQLDMDSCDFSRDEQAYVDAMKQLETCAQTAIANHSK